MRKLMDGEDYIHPQLLASLPRREALAKIGGMASLALLTACGANSTFQTEVDSGGTSNAGSSPSSPSSCSVIPSETIGPYPASQLLRNSWIYRSNISEDRTGVPFLFSLNLLDVQNSCAPIEGAAVYLWHCDKDGNYSGYNSYSSATFLRGVQVSDANGQVTFQTIYPGWYNGRITHMHFEIFLNNNLSGQAVKVSQVAFPQALTQSVYSSNLYKARGQNTSVASFSADGIFSDGVASQLATVTGDASSGLVGSLYVGI